MGNGRHEQDEGNGHQDGEDRDQGVRLNPCKVVSFVLQFRRVYHMWLVYTYLLVLIGFNMCKSNKQQ